MSIKAYSDQQQYPQAPGSEESRPQRGTAVLGYPCRPKANMTSSPS